MPKIDPADAVGLKLVPPKGDLVSLVFANEFCWSEPIVRLPNPNDPFALLFSLDVPNVPNIPAD